MADARSGRIVRRAVMALVVVVLLPVWYVAAWLAMSKATHDGYVNWSIADMAGRFFVPVRYFSGCDHPGSRQLNDIWWTLNPPLGSRKRPLFSPSIFLAPYKDDVIVRHESTVSSEDVANPFSNHPGFRPATETWPDVATSRRSEQ